MSVACYSPCRIQFVPNSQPRNPRDYSERTLIELRQYEFNDYSLRAVDVANNSEEIFNIPLKKQDQYKYGRAADQPDEIRSNNGTYHLWLNDSVRNRFHEAVRTCLELIIASSQSNETRGGSRRDNTTGANNRRDAEPTTPNPTIPTSKDLLLDVQRLGKYITQGDAHIAAQLASQLATNGIRLQAKFFEKTPNESEFTIQVQLDGNEYNLDQHGAKYPINVFPSTTIRELRALFELAYQCSPIGQYFFVNGHLAPDNSSMLDLQVGPNSLFVLFQLTHARTFQQNGPWKCLGCNTDNDQNRLRCNICSAARQN